MVTNFNPQLLQNVFIYQLCYHISQRPRDMPQNPLQSEDGVEGAR